MTKNLHRTMIVGTFLAELLTLLELYVQTLLLPGPFNVAAIFIIGLFGAASCAFAYLCGSLLRKPSDMKSLSPTQIIAKPPFVVWSVAVAIILFQLTSGLIMVHLANKK